MNKTGTLRSLLPGVLMTVGLSACATLETSVDVAEDANISAYKTFAWISESPVINAGAGHSELASPLNDLRVRNALETELIGKGYSPAPIEEADLVIGYTLSARDQVTVRNHYDNFGYRYYGYYPGFRRFGFRPFGISRYANYSYGFGGYTYGPRQTVSTSTEGMLVVDVFENQRKESIWHGTATKRIDRDDNGKELIAEAVDSLVAQFPDRIEMTAMLDSIDSDS